MRKQSHICCSEGKLGYETKSYYHNEGVHGYFVVAVETPSGEGSDAESFVLKELERIEEEGIPGESFEVAKRKFISAVASKFQYTLHTAYFLASSTFIDSPYRTISSLEERISEVTREEVCRVAESLFVELVVSISKSDLRQ